MKKGKYLITGCAGFIGSHLVKTLFNNYDVILVDDLSEGSRSKLPKSLQKKLIRRKIQDIKNLILTIRIFSHLFLVLKRSGKFV